jgi:hypothetical protein
MPPRGDILETLWHPVPRLDAPDRVWLLPAPQAKWLGAGVFSGPLVAQALVVLGGYGPADVWSLPVVWIAWLAGALVGALGAFWRPCGPPGGAPSSPRPSWPPARASG